MEFGTPVVETRTMTGPLGTSIQVDVNPEADPGQVIRAAHREFDRLLKEGLQGETLLVRIEPDDERAALVAIVAAPKLSGFGRVAIFDDERDGYIVVVSPETNELGTVLKATE